jgi:hypothetical protein
MGAILRLGFQSPVDENRNLFITDRTRRPGLWFIIQAGKTLVQKSPPPFSHRWLGKAQCFWDGGVVYAVGSHQDYLRSLCQTLGQRA